MKKTTMLITLSMIALTAVVSAQDPPPPQPTGGWYRLNYEEMPEADVDEDSYHSYWHQWSYKTSAYVDATSLHSRAYDVVTLEEALASGGSHYEYSEHWSYRFDEEHLGGTVWGVGQSNDWSVIS